MLGILLINKPIGGTSHDVVHQLRRRFNTRRIGHAGTLDPLATGLLVVAVGAATRFLQYLALEPKEYIGTIQFGRTSTTYDREGELSEPAPIPEDFGERLSSAVAGFVGLIQQRPPLYSAVKVAGKPLYHYARQGMEAPREPRTVFVERFEIEPQGGGEVAFQVECSGGTYVRSLAHDLGQAIEVGAYLASLRRIRSGRFRVEEAVELDRVSESDLIPLAEALRPMPMLALGESQVKAIRLGQRVTVTHPPGGRLAALLAPHGAVIGIAQVEGHELQPECVLPLESEDG